MPDSPTPRNVALLIDADNASSNTIDPVLTVLAELGTVNVRRVYGNWSKPALKGWKDMSLKHGIEPQQQFDLTKGKNATDMKMTIDAMDLLSRGRIEGFGIMSSDSDFMPLAMRIRQDGIPVYGFGTSRTPEAFKQACTRFIDVGVLTAELAPPPLAAEGEPARTRSRRGRGGKATEAPAVATLPADTPAVAPSEDDDEDSIEHLLPPSIVGASVRGSEAAMEVGPELLKLLVDAYNSVKRDERGYVSLSAMGQLAGNRSSFDARNYGFRRLSDLIEAVPNFRTERRADGRLFVKRVS